MVENKPAAVSGGSSPRQRGGDESSGGKMAHPARLRHATRESAIWIGLFGGLFAFAAQTVTNYAVSSHACFAGRIPYGQQPSIWVWWTLMAVTAAAICITCTSIWLACDSWRATSHEASRKPPEDRAHELLEVGEGRTRFMAMAGLVTSCILLAAIILNGTAMVIMPLCRTIP